MRIVVVRVPRVKRTQVENIIRAGRYRNVSVMKSADRLALHFLFRARARRLQLLLQLLDQIGVGRVFGSYDIIHLDVNKMAPGPLGRGIVNETGLDPDLDLEENPRFPLVVHSSSEASSSENDEQEDESPTMLSSSSSGIPVGASQVELLDSGHQRNTSGTVRRRSKKRQNHNAARRAESMSSIFDSDLRGKVHELLKDDAAVAAAATASRGSQQRKSSKQADTPTAQANAQVSAWDGLSKDEDDDGGRLPLEEIWISIANNSRFSFDFAMYIVFASIIAGLGLATNGSVSVVAAMLVSPLMNPILGFTFGTQIRDWKLVRNGLVTASIGVFLALLSGFVIGLCFIPFIGPQDTFPWPTTEMKSRGEAPNLVVGAGVASASGAAVALSVILGGISPLVGVAISASLLPPIVNAGIFLAYSFLGHLRNPNFDSRENARLAGISFALSMVNIACIYIFGLLVFWLKDILPIKTHSLMVSDLRFDLEEMWKLEEEVEAGDVEKAFSEHPTIPESVKIFAAQTAGVAPPVNPNGRSRSGTLSSDPRRPMGAFPFFGFGTSTTLTTRIARPSPSPNEDDSQFVRPRSNSLVKSEGVLHSVPSDSNLPIVDEGIVLEDGSSSPPRLASPGLALETSSSERASMPRGENDDILISLDTFSEPGSMSSTSL